MSLQCDKLCFRSDAIWVAWEDHRRTRGLCQYFGIKTFLFTSSLPRLIKHPYFLVSTWLLLIKERPRVLFVQNPSVVLALLACVLHKRFKYKLIVDAHNAGIRPDFKKAQLIRSLYATIVTNASLAQIVKENGGRPLVLPDRIPTPPPGKIRKLSNKINVVCICAFGNDEPFEEVINSAKYLSDEITVYLTGNYAKLGNKVLSSLPRNIILTGYLEDDDYWSMLYSADLIIDLTERDDCLVCGAYEAVAVETPLVLSDTEILRKYFYKGAVFTKNDAKRISTSIDGALKRIDLLRIEVRELKEELNDAWSVNAEKIKQYFQ